MSRKPPSKTTLEAAKQRVLDAEARMKTWHDQSYEQIADFRTAFETCLRDFDKAAVNAIRLGLLDDPDIALSLHIWLAARRLVGDREVLRDAEKGATSGLATGVKSPPSPVELWIWSVIDRYKGWGKSVEQARRFMVCESEAIAHDPKAALMLNPRDYSGYVRFRNSHRAFLARALADEIPMSSAEAPKYVAKKAGELAETLEKLSNEGLRKKHLKLRDW